jgi:hypothetical protein
VQFRQVFNKSGTDPVEEWKSGRRATGFILNHLTPIKLFQEVTDELFA